MSTDDDAKIKLDTCLNELNNLVTECLEKLKKGKDSASRKNVTDDILTNSQLNNDIYTISVDRADIELLDRLTEDLERILNEQLNHLSQIYSNYLLDFLHTFNYDREKHKFTASLTAGLLQSFQHELKGLQEAIEGYPAGFNGDLARVKQFLKKYPAYKDRPGLWETTLLYSAARNNFYDLVKYLVEDEHCSVDAQNQRDVDFALKNAGSDFKIRATAGSTALHAACFNNHVNIVKYLVEHGADYFVHNQALETPIDNAIGNESVYQYFEEYLILNYAISRPKQLPVRTIMNERNRPMRDSMWEYKPFLDEKWYKFSKDEADILHNAMIPTGEFQQEVHLKVPKAMYRVSTLEFVRSARNNDDSQKNMAWIRCRGSNVLNFDCFCIWQIMLIKHRDVKMLPDDIPSLKIDHTPSLLKSDFKLQLHNWYKCDARTNAYLDRSMDYRRKVIRIGFPFIGNGFKLNLQSFEFSNNDKTILGYVRWIPKLTSMDDSDGKLIEIDNYQTMTGIRPIPLTVKRFKANHAGKKDSDTKDDENFRDDFDENCTSGYTDEFDADDDDLLADKDDNETGNIGTWSLTELSDEVGHGSIRQKMPPITSSEGDIFADDFFHERVGELEQAPRVERRNSAIKIKQNTENVSRVNDEIEHLKRKLAEEQAKLEKQKQSAEKLSKEQEAQLKQRNSLVAQLQDELNRKKLEQQKIKEAIDKLQVIVYSNIEIPVVQNYFIAKINHIVNHLRETGAIDQHLVGIPSLTMTQVNTYYCLTLTGFDSHHEEFKQVLRRIQTLSSVTQSAIRYYRRLSTQAVTHIYERMTNQIQSTADWKFYTKYFNHLLTESNERLSKTFEEFIVKESQAITEQCVTIAGFQSSRHLRQLTTNYIVDHPFLGSIESIKQQALDEFIEQQIFSQQLKYEKKPSNKSIQTLKKFIHKIKQEFQTNKALIGTELKHFQEIPKLIKRLMLFYRAFLLQLPLYESAEELTDKIEKSCVVTIATSTGLGKSTLLPALLIAEGYDKVLVTQPRRLPCTSICERVNTTMTNGKDDHVLAGWAVSGDEKNVKAQILYLTDGLLKERLLYDENIVTSQTQVDKSIVFFIDEVHERSINIDLCLALIARLLSEKSVLRSKIKVVISSATLDPSVPNLFRKIPGIKFDEFQMPFMGTRYTVTKVPRPHQNILELVQELCAKRQRNEQILCFVSSVSEVQQCCRLLEDISHRTIIAFPLVQSQPAHIQQTYIENGSIFFSTTIAETSLTFPSLKYVVDTGMINTPIYDIDKKQTTLMEVRAAESTVKQRLGRVGRTSPGDYYSLYDFKVEEKKYPTPQICQSDLVSIEFSLRKSPIKQGLEYLKQYLPNPPTAQAIQAAVKELKELDIIDAKGLFTTTGHALSKLPDFGSLQMSKAVLAALNQYNSGRDLIVLSSILSVLNTTSVLQNIPTHVKRPEGDFMSLLNMMNEILLVRESVSSRQFNLKKVCHALGLTPIAHILRQALRRYISLETAFNLSEDYLQKARISSNNWEFIARSLLTGFSDHVFVSMKELQGKTHLFTRYGSSKEEVAVLDLQSTVARSISTAPVALVLARDIRFSSSVRATAVLSFVGEIQPDWIQYRFTRKLTLNTAEETKLNTDQILTIARQKYSTIDIKLVNHTVILEGIAGLVLKAELYILENLIVEMTFTLENDFNPQDRTNYERMQHNLEGVAKMPRIFRPMIWRWEAQHQVKITVNNSASADTCEIIIQGRDSQNQSVKKEFNSFMGWLKNCAVIRHPSAGVSPRILKPQIRATCLDIEERITRIANSKRTSIELWKALKGSNATRESRMEVVAWIAICKFDCRLEGGFVRDWIVGQYQCRPSGDPSTWIYFVPNKAGVNIPYLNKDLIPCDLDVHLPIHRYFDIDKFLDALHRFQIPCRYIREDWRYVLLFDEHEKTGPFTMDLIEPHVTLTHDRIDFDVSNLSVEKDYAKELGMRVDIQQKPYSIELETIVDNIKKKLFRVLRPIDSLVQTRIDKMEQRGWTQSGEPMHVIPDPPPKYHVVLVSLPESTELYSSIVDQMTDYLGDQVEVISIEEIKNPLLQDTYLAMKRLIAKQCKGHNPNERELFHGTKGEAIDGILNDGFDDRFWGTNYSRGNWGHGAYFADNPSVSHGYTEPDEHQRRIMYYNKVTLGREYMMQEIDQELMSAPKLFHSVHGQYRDYPHSDEYIVYRYGQALPYLRITYRC